MAWKKEMSKEEKDALKEKKKEDMEAIFRRIDEGVKEVFTSEKYMEYLRVMSKFTDYSARNTLLIAMQKPDASLVAAYGKWKQLGRQVKKGESGIELLAPVAYKTNRFKEIKKPILVLYHPLPVHETLLLISLLCNTLHPLGLMHTLLPFYLNPPLYIFRKPLSATVPPRKTDMIPV